MHTNKSVIYFCTYLLHSNTRHKFQVTADDRTGPIPRLLSAESNSVRTRCLVDSTNSGLVSIARLNCSCAVLSATLSEPLRQFPITKQTVHTGCSKLWICWRRFIWDVWRQRVTV